MNYIMHGTASEKEEILALYKSQLGREFCPWTEFYPTEKEIDFDLSRDSLFVMKIKRAVSSQLFPLIWMLM